MKLLLFIVVSIIVSLFLIEIAHEKTAYQSKWASEREMIVYEIKQAARTSGVSEIVSLRIALCESNFDPSAQNSNSTAYGIYQFLDKTWKYTGGGDRHDYKLQIQRFMEVYPKHPSWWECK